MAVTRRNPAELLTGACVLLVAGGFLAYAVAASGYLLHAAFDHIDGMATGSDVRLAGVKIGTVQGATIDPKTYLADVTLSVRGDVKLPTDSSAEITSDGLLGGKYLALAPGGAEAMLPAGGTITVTQGSVSLEQLLGKFIFSMTDKKPAASQPASPAPSSPQAGPAPVPAR